MRRVCNECGDKAPHEVKQILLAKQSITEIENLGLSLFSVVVVVVVSASLTISIAKQSAYVIEHSS